MDIKLTHRLSFKQARLTVLVGFVLGTILSLLQIGMDYASENAAINREIESLLDISHNPASRIAYNLDSELAQELVMGLLRAPAITGVQISDNDKNLLASGQDQPDTGRYRALSDFLFGSMRTFDDRLYFSHLPEQSVGVLHLEVDTYPFGSRFLHRAELTLLSGFARSLLLTFILLALFYVMLTKPLVRVIGELSRSKPGTPTHRASSAPAGMKTTKSVYWSTQPISSLTP